MSSENTKEEDGLGTMRFTADGIGEPPANIGGYDRDTYDRMVAASEIEGQQAAIDAYNDKVAARRLRHAAVASKLANALRLKR